MDALEQIKNFLRSLLKSIDNGMFFIKPMRWFYTFCAWIIWALPIGVAFAFYNVISNGNMFEYIGGWASFCVILFMIAGLGVALFTAYFYYNFWTHRREAIQTFVKKGDQIVAIPLFAHCIQSIGEAIGLFIAIIPSLSLVLVFLCSLISGSRELRGILEFVGSDNFFEFLIMGIIGVALICLIFIIIGYFNILFMENFADSVRWQLQKVSAENEKISAGTLRLLGGVSLWQ